MRVALVLPFAPGANRGNSTAASRLASGLATVGVAVETVSLEVQGIPFGPAGAAAARDRLAADLAPFRPDVVHVLHGYRAGPAGVAAAAALGAALVVGLRGTDVSIDLADPGRREDLLATLEAADAVVAFADFMLAPVLAARPALAARSAVVPHGVAERFLAEPPSVSGTPPPLPAPPPGGTLFVLPANLRAVKAPGLAVAGLDPVVAVRPGVRLAVVGPVLEPEVGRELALAVATRPWATLVGEVPHPGMPALLRAADVVLGTSVAEGMPNAILEAMAVGRAVLLSDIPAHRTIVESGVSGLLFDASDSQRAPAALAREAVRLVDDPALRARLGREAAARVRVRHTVREEVRRMLAVYEAALARRRSARGSAG